MRLDLSKVKPATEETDTLTLNEATKAYALQVLESQKHNVSAACRILGVPRTRLYKILGGIPKSKFEGRRPKLELTLARLTPRQLQIKDLILQGLPNKAIAERVGLTIKGVKYHNTIIYKVYGVKTKGELVAKLLGVV